MTIYIEDETPGVCKNKECVNYQSFEKYPMKDVNEDEKGAFVSCYECKQRIAVR